MLGVDNGLKEEVALLQLVVEEEVVVRECQLAEVVLLDHLCTQHVKTCEQPATARLLLVGDALGLHAVREVGVDHCKVVGICCKRGDSCLRHGVACCTVGSILRIRRANLLEHSLADASLVLLCAKRAYGHKRNSQSK